MSRSPHHNISYNPKYDYVSKKKDTGVLKFRYDQVGQHLNELVNKRLADSVRISSNRMIHTSH